MLYKKIHRRYLRQFRVGRKFKFNPGNEVYKVVRKPYIIDEDYTIYVDFGYVDYDDYDDLDLIRMSGQVQGLLRYKFRIYWLD